MEKAVDESRTKEGTVVVPSSALAPLTEACCGITAYANNAVGFNCTLKERFSDFIVNEIDKDGRVIILQRIPLLTESKRKREPSIESFTESAGGNVKMIIENSSSETCSYNLRNKILLDISTQKKRKGE